jgi:ADP-ribose pyrophosphatase YjhB (NUDIX family)
MAAAVAEARTRIVCPSCGYIAYARPKTGAGVLVERDGQLLLVQRGPNLAFAGTWGLPAGYCEVNESPRQTAAREVAEETGYEVQVGALEDVYYFDDDPRGNGLLIVYRADITGGQTSCDGIETTTIGFFPVAELPRPLCGGGHDRAIRAWQIRAMDRWQPGSPLRYCPHCALPLLEREAFGRIRPTCQSCGFVHFQELKVGVSVLVEKEGRILLIRRAVDPGLGKWGLPSGFVEWDESPERAAVRETAEETGLTVSNLVLADVCRYTDDFRGPGINILYRASVVEGHIQAGDDADKVRFFSATGLPPSSQIAFQGHRRTLEEWSTTARDCARKAEQK